MAILLASLALFSDRGVALANGGDIHFGGLSTGIPPAVAWAAGGITGLVFLFLIVGWVYSYRALKQSAKGMASSSSDKGEEEEP